MPNSSRDWPLIPPKRFPIRRRGRRKPSESGGARDATMWRLLDAPEVRRRVYIRKGELAHDEASRVGAWSCRAHRRAPHANARIAGEAGEELRIDRHAAISRNRRFDAQRIVVTSARNGPSALAARTSAGPEPGTAGPKRSYSFRK